MDLYQVGMDQESADMPSGRRRSWVTTVEAKDEGDAAAKGAEAMLRTWAHKAVASVFPCTLVVRHRPSLRMWAYEVGYNYDQRDGGLTLRFLEELTHG